MSGQLTKGITKIHEQGQKIYFPENIASHPWTETTKFKRYHLAFPSYPFRTLCPRELYRSKLTSSEGEQSSPLFPAHTQLDLLFKRRSLDPKTGLLNQMLPYSIPEEAGTFSAELTPVFRNQATRFTVLPVRTADTPASILPAALTLKHYTIEKVSIELKDVYLQV